VVEAREVRRSCRALHRARVHGVEVDAVELSTKVPCVLLAARRERQVGDACVAPRTTPLGLAVAGEIELEAQAGLPIISGRPERRDRLALSITAPARTR
jgi:hypothetical protein